MFGFIGIGWRTGGWSRVVSSRLPSKGYHTIRVGLVRTDASCVRPMGYLAIFFAFFLPSYLRLLRFSPPKDASRTQKVGFASYLRPSISA